jgi:hypothetical protein
MSERDYLVSKAWRGESGDKRNAKYAAAAGAGALTASRIAGAAPLDRRIKRTGLKRGTRAMVDDMMYERNFSNNIRAGMQAQYSTPGFKRVAATRTGAGVAGATAATAAYAAYRRNKKKV